MVLDTLIKNHPKSLKDLLVSGKMIKLCGICVIFGVISSTLSMLLAKIHHNTPRNLVAEEIVVTLIILCIPLPGFWLPLGYLLTNDKAKTMFQRAVHYLLKPFIGCDPLIQVTT